MASIHTLKTSASVQCMYCAVARLLSDTGRLMAEDVPRDEGCAGCRARHPPAIARPKSLGEFKSQMGVAGSSREGRHQAQRDPNATVRSGSNSLGGTPAAAAGGDRTITSRAASGAGVTLIGGVSAGRPRTAPSTPSRTPTPHTTHARTPRFGDSITASRYADFDAYIATAEAREAKRAASGSSPAHAWLSLHRTGTMTSKMRSSSATRLSSSTTIATDSSSSAVSGSSLPSPTSPKLKRAATTPIAANGSSTFPPTPAPAPTSAKLELLATSYARARLAWYRSNVHRIPPAVDADELERMYRAYMATCPTSGRENDDGLPPLVCSQQRVDKLRGGKEVPNFPVRDVWTALGGEPDDGWEILEAVDRERR